VGGLSLAASFSIKVVLALTSEAGGLEYLHVDLKAFGTMAISICILLSKDE
jgi:hypothetical protein